MAKVNFGGGAELDTTASARAAVEVLAKVAGGGECAQDQGQPLPIGYVALHTDHGPVYVNAAQVAYVRD